MQYNIKIEEINNEITNLEQHKSILGEAIELKCVEQTELVDLICYYDNKIKILTQEKHKLLKKGGYQ